MAVFKSFDPNVEVNGQTVLSISDAMGHFRDKGLDILAQNGIVDPQPGQWYPQQSWLDAFKQISDEIGENTLFAIGKKIPENAKFPPDIDNIDRALASIDVAYHMNHRNGEIGHYKYEMSDDHSGKMICNTPYPSDFDRGIIYAMADKFKPAGSFFIEVKLDESAPTRKKGADSCTYLIKW